MGFLTDIKSVLIGYLFTIPVLLIAFPVHELSHGLMANRLGDPTAKYMGRLTLNPLKHLDVMGTICLILFRFGWAKPVPVNPNNFKNPRGGMAITALAGPVSNLIMAFVSMFLWGGYDVLAGQLAPSPVSYIVTNFLYTSAVINIGLCIFNLIPIPPLDGERILAFFLPQSLQDFFDRYGMYFQVGLMLLLFFTSVLTAPLSNMVNNVFMNFAAFINSFFGHFFHQTQVLWLQQSF